jgi:hypothetical protein
VAYTVFQRGARNQAQFGGANLERVVNHRTFNRRTGKWVYQFSPMANPWAHRWNQQSLNNAYQAVYEVLHGLWKPPANEYCVLYFRTLGGHFRNLLPVAEVGRHRFYCDPKEVYAALNGR